MLPKPPAVPANKQLQRTMIPRRFTWQRAAAELRL
jgi:hypothetical protein